MDNAAILSFIGLMRKAGALAPGADAAAESCQTGKAKIVLLASDTSENTVKWLKSAAAEREVPIIPLSCDKNDFGGALGMGGCAVAAVCDTGFALALCKKLGLGQLESALEPKFQREKRRKAKKLAVKGKADTSKRGK